MQEKYSDLKGKLDIFKRAKEEILKNKNAIEELTKELKPKKEEYINLDNEIKKLRVDILEIESIVVDADEIPAEENDIKSKLLDGGKKASEKISGLFAKKTPVAEKTTNNNNEIIETIKKLSELKDYGIITQEEFDSKKSELLAKL